MKKLLFTTVFLIFAFTANTDANTDFAKRVGGYFYSSLSPYGTWIEIGYGTPVWRPTMIRKTWAPYRMGQWIYTDYGWYWDSYEDFGYITYHYGRWYYDDYYGWIWIPDYEWAPAWVDWRYDDDYIGWAPLSPYALFSINIGIHYTYDYYVPYEHWNYVKYNHFCDHNVYDYYVGPKYKYRVHNRTKERTNYSYYDGRVRNDGVEFDRIRERNGRNIEKRNIISVNDPGELTREKITKTRDKEIKTYIANRDDISRDGLRDIKIKRDDRKTTLDLNKVELGRDRNNERFNETRKDERNDVIRKDNERSNVDLNKREKIENNRNTNNDKNRNNSVEERKLQEKRELEKRNSEIEKRNNEQIKRNEEIKRQDEFRKSEEKKKYEEVKRNEQIQLQKRQEQERIKRNDINNQRKETEKNNTRISNQNNERKVEQKNQDYNSNRNNEIKRDDMNKRNNSNSNGRNSDNNRKSR